MPSILKKLFSRSKDPEATGILSSSQYGAVVASSSSDPFRQQQQQQQQQSQQQQMLSKKELKKQEKQAKKEAKRHAKLQKKKDKLGSFSNNVGELPDKSKFRSAAVVTATNTGGASGSSAAVSRNGGAGVAMRSNSSGYVGHQHQQQSRQLAESMRSGMVEEKENSPATSASSLSYHHHHHSPYYQQQPPHVLSPSSQASSAQRHGGHSNNYNLKPPLNTTNNHHNPQRRPSPPQQQSSPDSNTEEESSMLRGVAIHVTNSYLEEEQNSAAMMCFSNSYDDEEYNAVALATAMGEHAAGIANQAKAEHLDRGVGDGMKKATTTNNSNGKGKEEKFVSVLDRSPFSFTSDDGANALFPALAGDDGDPFRQQRQQQQMMMMQQQQQHRGGEELIATWSPTGADVENMGNFSFQDEPPPPPPPPLPQSVPPQQVEQPVIGFDPSFAEFEPFGNSSSEYYGTSTPTPPAQSSKSVGGQNNVTSILEETRMKRRSSRNNLATNGGQSSPHDSAADPSRIHGGSINSAPTTTLSDVRNQVQRSKGRSISRVIDNLELHVNKRQGNAPSTRGGASASGENTFRETKERIRRENMSQDSKIIDMLAAGDTAGAMAAAKSTNTAAANSENWLFDEVTGALGPRSVAADLESLGGRSNRSGKSRSSHLSHRSKKSSRGHRRHRSKGKMMGSDGSVDSRTSRNSYRSYKSTRSMVSQMSEQSRSVANDLLRLEAQLSMVGKSRREGGGGSVSGGSVKSRGGIGASGSGSVVSKQRDDCGATVTSRDYSVGRSSRKHISASARKAAVRSLRSKVTVVAPPGKLGIILANRTDSRGTVVSGVRTASVLAAQVSPGDRIIAIDDEDVSQMNVKEITTIMARKSEFERVLTLLAAPKMQYD